MGWDDVGDLRAFESKDAFRQRFLEVFAEKYKHNKGQMSKKVNELWTLMELKPGDLVVANQGISKVLAVGEVVEPGYEWMRNGRTTAMCCVYTGTLPANRALKTRSGGPLLQ